MAGRVDEMAATVVEGGRAAGMAIGSAAAPLASAAGTGLAAAGEGAAAAAAAAGTGLAAGAAAAGSGLAAGAAALPGVAADAGELAGAGLAAVRDGAATAGNVLGAGASAAYEFGGTAVTWTAEAVTAANAVSREHIALLAAAAATMTAQAFDLVKLEVARDYFQVVALFFASLLSPALEGAKTVWGNVSTFINIDWSFTFPRIDPVPIYIALLVIGGIVMLLILVMMAMTCCTTHDEIREGAEHRSWDRKAREDKCSIRFIKVRGHYRAQAHTRALSALPLRAPFACRPCSSSRCRPIYRWGESSSPY